MRHREVPLRVVLDGVVRGAHGLDESVARGHAGVGVGGNEARYEGEAQLRVGGSRCDLKEKRKTFVFFKTYSSVTYHVSEVKSTCFV